MEIVRYYLDNGQNYQRTDEAKEKLLTNERLCEIAQVSRAAYYK